MPTTASGSTRRWHSSYSLPRAVAEVMQHLLADPNPRVRLVAASYLLSTGSYDAEAGAVLVDALAAPVPRVREEALDLFESLECVRGRFSKNFRNSTDPMVTRNRRKPLILLSNPSTSELAKDFAAEGKHLGLRGVMGLRWVGARFSILSAEGLLRWVGGGLLRWVGAGCRPTGFQCCEPARFPPAFSSSPMTTMASSPFLVSEPRLTPRTIRWPSVASDRSTSEPSTG